MPNDSIPSITGQMGTNKWDSTFCQKTKRVVPYKEPIPVGKAQKTKNDRAKTRRIAPYKEGVRREELSSQAYSQIGPSASAVVRMCFENGYNSSDIEIGKKSITVKRHSYDKQGNMTDKIIGKEVYTFDSNGAKEKVVVTIGNKRLTTDYRPNDYSKQYASRLPGGYSWTETIEEKVNGKWVVKDRNLQSLYADSQTAVIRDGKLLSAAESEKLGDVNSLVYSFNFNGE